MKKLFFSLVLIFVVLFARSQSLPNYWVPTTGTNTYVTSITGFGTVYSNKVAMVRFVNANSGASTINISGLGPIDLKRWDGDSWEAMVSGDIPANSNAILSYDNSGSYFKTVVYENIGSGGEFNYTIEIISGTTHTIDNDDNNKFFIYTNASGCAVTLPNTVTAPLSFTAVRDTGAGTTTFDDDGTSVLETDGGNVTLEGEERWASWIKVNSTDWKGTGALGTGSGSQDFQSVMDEGSTANIGNSQASLVAQDGSNHSSWDVTPSETSMASSNNANTENAILRVNTDGVQLEDTRANRGLQGSADYSANIQANDYTQKNYVDTGLAGKVSSVSGDGVDNTDPLNPVMDLSGYTPNITTFNSQSSDYTFEASDGNGNTEVQLTGTTPHTFTIPNNTSVPYAIGTILYARRTGDDPGVLSWAAAAGVTITTTKGNLTDPGKNVLMGAKKTGTNSWILSNGLSFSLSSGDVTSALGYTPVPPTRTVAGVDLVDNITAGELKTAVDGWHRVTISSDVVFASTSYADITDLLVPISANTRIEFRGWLYIDAANSAEGWTSSFTGPTLTTTRYMHSGFAASNAIVTHLSTSYDESAALLSASTLSSMGEIAGRVITSASGNIQFRLKTETGAVNITVKSGSYVEYRVVGVNN